MTRIEDDQLTTNGSEAPASAETWVRAFADGWRAPANAEEFVDHFRPWLQPDYRFSQPLTRTGVGIGEFTERFARPLFALVPDLHLTVLDWAARGRTLFVEILVEGTVGGRRVTMPGCDRITLRDGLAATRVTYANPAPLLRALARTPGLWPRAAATLLAEFGRRRR